MIASITRGDRTRGVLAYVYGPGDEDEHTNQHTVASFEPFLPDPGRDPDFDAALAQLTDILDLRVVQAGKRAPKDHVWHCSLRAAPEDRHLSDAEWEQIARRVMHAAGIAKEGDPDACRWVVVRHAEDHVHIVATAVRANLTHARLHNDYGRVMKELARIETDYGLREVDHTFGRGTMAKAPTRAEVHKAKRQGREQTVRESLRTALRQALAGAANEDEFLAHVAAQGVRVKVRRLPSGDAQGFSFHLPGDRNGKGEPVWFPGSELGPDLTLPKIRARLAAGADEPAPGTSVPDSAAPALATATGTVRHVLHAVRTTTSSDSDDAGGESGRDELPMNVVVAWSAGFGEVLDAVAQTHHGPGKAELRAAAKAWGRAAYAHDRAADRELRALRSAARQILAGGPSFGRGKDADAVMILLDALLLLGIALYRSHQADGHRQHARTAQAAADQLEAAARQAAAAPTAVLQAQARGVPGPVRQELAEAVRQALPAHLAEQVVAGPGWAGLAGVLEQARRAGKDPAGLLAGSAGERELDSAKDPAAVLTWRVRHLADLPPLPVGAHRAAAAKGRKQPKAADQAQAPHWQPGQPTRGRGR
ncbi:relaxase/mobilization nuclease domain-containing protein [Streptacidiphilus melanogenes]|uniref:relaxase/mobilization nuclease domain-containing protein n=1 Tax=Streptacidiphilus melanogenes TaxID=411235 RepID=UPI0005A8CD79|nr:relaxase/mobilization nuclease domain-containing protein [Streptacidiphilus melanogenes]